MYLNRISVQMVLISVLLLTASLAQAAQTTTFCVYGTGDGSAWDWEVRFHSSTAVEIGRCTGTATAPVSASANTIRDLLVEEISDACGIVVTAMPVPSPGSTCLTHPAFQVDGFFAFELWLEDKGMPGTLALVGELSPVEFNPFVFIDAPEPSSALLLSTGVLGLVALNRRRAQRRHILN